MYVRQIISITLEHWFSKRRRNLERNVEEMHPLFTQGESMDNYKGMHTVFICFKESNDCTCHEALFYIKDKRFWFTILYFYLAEYYIQSFSVFLFTFYIFVASFLNRRLIIDYLVLVDK